MKDAEIDRLGPDGMWSRNLAKEAFVQSQLTNDRPECFIKLKGYRYYKSEGRCRYYMEYAKHGSLEQIRKWHRAWDTYLPEEFLWTVFHELALAVAAMERCPGRWQPYSNAQRDQQNPANYILHVDLKADNVFLCDRTRLRPPITFAHEYPQIKIGDLGLAQVTGPADPDKSGHPNNAFNFFHLGGQECRTPEQRRFGQAFGPPGPVNGGYGAGFQFTPMQNIWQDGLILHDLMRLNRYDFVDTNVENCDRTPLGNPGSYTDPIPGTVPPRPRLHFINMPSTRKTAPDYSDHLRRLVWDCLKPEANQRPTAANLVNRTGAGVRTYLGLDRIAPINGRPQRRGPVGSVALTPAGFEWVSMRERKYQDPDQPQLAPPGAKWQVYYQDEGPSPPPQYAWDEWRRVGEHVHPVEAS